MLILIFDTPTCESPFSSTQEIILLVRSNPLLQPNGMFCKSKVWFIVTKTYLLSRFQCVHCCDGPTSDAQNLDKACAKVKETAPCTFQAKLTKKRTLSKNDSGTLFHPKLEILLNFTFSNPSSKTNRFKSSFSLNASFCIST